MEDPLEQLLARALELDASQRQELAVRLFESVAPRAGEPAVGSVEALPSAGLRRDLGEQPPPEAPRLYSEFASWWPLLSAPSEYEEEANVYRSLLLAACEEPPHTLLELGSGGGNNASHLKAHFQMTLIDRSSEMLAVSRVLNPECEHLQGDMRAVRLGRVFDCVFVHDAIVYMLTESDLRLAIETAFVHCRPGGAALFAPDLIRENFRPSTGHGGHDGAKGEHRGVRYLSWTWDPDPTDTTYIADYTYMLREEDGTIRLEHDRHTEGLFARADWLRLLAEVGFRPSVVPFEHSEIEYGACELFVGRKPALQPNP